MAESEDAVRGPSPNRPRAQSNLHPTVSLGQFVALGVPSEETLRATQGGNTVLADVTVEAGCIIQNFVTLYEGVHLEQDVVVDDYCRVGPHSRIGARCRVIYGAFISDNVRVGTDCRIAGFICDDTVIETRCSVMGTVVHEYTQPHLNWW